jgi:hypothetical protein
LNSFPHHFQLLLLTVLLPNLFTASPMNNLPPPLPAPPAPLACQSSTTNFSRRSLAQLSSGVRNGPGAARPILLFHIIRSRPSNMPLMVRTFLKVCGAWLLFFVSARTNRRHHQHVPPPPPPPFPRPSASKLRESPK